MKRWIGAVSAALMDVAAMPAQAADKVVLMLNWYVYGEHAPFYYGKAKGIYAAEASISRSRKAAARPRPRRRWRPRPPISAMSTCPP